MANDLIQQEILLMVNSNFTKQLLHKDTCDEKTSYLIAEQLEDACWNGMLEDMLPGIIEKNDGTKLFLWHVKHNNDCIELELGEYPQQSDLFYTINPRGFLMAKNFN